MLATFISENDYIVYKIIGYTALCKYNIYFLIIFIFLYNLYIFFNF